MFGIILLKLGTAQSNGSLIPGTTSKMEPRDFGMEQSKVPKMPLIVLKTLGMASKSGSLIFGKVQQAG